MATIKFWRLLCLLSTICAVVGFVPPHPHGPPQVRRKPPPWINHGEGPPPWITQGGDDDTAPPVVAGADEAEDAPAGGSGSEGGGGEGVANSADSASSGTSGEAATPTSGTEDQSEEKGEVEGTAGQVAGWGGRPSFGGGDGGGFGGEGGFPGQGGDGGAGGFGGDAEGGRGGQDGQGGFGDGASQFLGFDIEKASLIRKIHGIIAAIVFVFVFPFGAILMRIVPGRFSVWIHAFVQMVGYAGYIAAAGLGIYLTQYVRIPTGDGSLLSDPNTNFHPIIGLVVLAALLLQPVFGLLHHSRFKKIRKRHTWSYLHIWIGRIFITLGIINGGLGLWIAGASKSLTISYGVVAAVIWSIWMLIALVTELRRKRAARRVRRKRRTVTTGSE